jgi:nucleoside-diphosphate-sugar epimerase
MKTRDAESVLVIAASGFIGQHLVCRLIGVCDNAMAQVWPLYPGSPLPFCERADSTQEVHP